MATSNEISVAIDFSSFSTASTHSGAQNAARKKALGCRLHTSQIFNRRSAAIRMTNLDDSYADIAYFKSLFIFIAMKKHCIDYATKS
jgi:hypothetical protein